MSKFEEYLETVKNNKPLSKCVTTDNQNVKIYPKDINTFINKDLLQYATVKEKNKLRNIPKEEINSKLNKSLNESTDTDLKNTLSKTIEKINSSKSDLYNLFKLQELNQGL
jgi:hypothetical protein